MPKCRAIWSTCGLKEEIKQTAYHSTATPRPGEKLQGSAMFVGNSEERPHGLASEIKAKE
jgi:hypothetical protein